MARACLGRRAHPDSLRARPEPCRAVDRPPWKEIMNDAASPLQIVPNAEPVTSGRTQVSIRDLDFFYGKTRALKKVNLEVPANAVTAVIGPSGCGKSPLLRSINRIFENKPNQQTKNKNNNNNHNVLDRRYALSDLRRKGGMVFQ